MHSPTGELIGTEHETTTVEITPSDLNTATSKETKTKTTTDSTGTVTGTQTTTEGGTPTAQEPTKWPTVEIDDTPDVDLPSYNMPATLSTARWGSGSCPANPSVSLHGLGVLTVPLQPVCNAMDLIRPIIILLALMGAAYIVMGAKQND